MNESCPFFRPSRSLSRDLTEVGIYQDLTAVGVYCGLPSGRVRVPSMEEVKGFCVPGWFRECPHYLRHAPAR
jgi:hypothetical protein